MEENITYFIIYLDETLETLSIVGLNNEVLFDIENYITASKKTFRDKGDAKEFGELLALQYGKKFRTEDNDFDHLDDDFGFLD